MSIVCAFLGNIVLVMRLCTDELLVAMMVFGWGCPISTRVTRSGLLAIVEEHSQLCFRCWTHNMFDDGGQGEDGAILNIMVFIC